MPGAILCRHDLSFSCHFPFHCPPFTPRSSSCFIHFSHRLPISLQPVFSLHPLPILLPCRFYSCHAFAIPSTSEPLGLWPHLDFAQSTQLQFDCIQSIRLHHDPHVRLRLLWCHQAFLILRRQGSGRLDCHVRVRVMSPLVFARSIIAASLPYSTLPHLVHMTSFTWVFPESIRRCSIAPSSWPERVGFSFLLILLISLISDKLVGKCCVLFLEVETERGP